MLLRAFAFIVVAGAVAGAVACSDDASTPDAIGPCVVGDPAANVDMEVVYRTAAGELAPLTNGTALPLVTPPQGGKVAFVGVRVRNVDVCGASVQGVLRDPCTDRVIGIERRPVAWQVADDGFAEPRQPAEISDYANIPACPNLAIDHDLDGHPARVEMRLYEASGRTTERLIDVVPTCADDFDPTLCRCECDSDYALGADCPADPDAGVIDCPPDAAP